MSNGNFNVTSFSEENGNCSEIDNDTLGGTYEINSGKLFITEIENGDMNTYEVTFFEVSESVLKLGQLASNLGESCNNGSPAT